MACENICPQQCIRIDISQRKNFEKIIDSNKCINCGLCEKVCPHISELKFHTPIYGMNVWARKKSVMRIAASGGIATLAYSLALDKGILCIGVYFDNKFRLRYQFINNTSDIYKSAGSKYVYSEMDDIYKKVEKYLFSGNRILFIGLPCHVAGLKQYMRLQNIDTEKLLTVELVCHGVSTPYLFQNYISYLQEKGILQVGDTIAHRRRYNPYGFTIIKNGERAFMKNRYIDEYLSLYYRGYYADSCYSCRFKKGKRISDITIMDCSTPTEKMLKKVRGSSVLINSEKGKRFFDELLPFLDGYEYPVESIINEDLMLQDPPKKPVLYDVFWVLESVFGFQKAEKMLYGIFGKITECYFSITNID